MDDLDDKFCYVYSSSLEHKLQIKMYAVYYVTVCCLLHGFVFCLFLSVVLWKENDKSQNMISYSRILC